MRGKNKVAIGFMAMMVITGIMSVSSSFASDVGQAAVTMRIGHGGSTYQSKSPQENNCPRQADVIERIGGGGSTYSSSQTVDCQVAGDERSKVKVIERIGAGGSTYFPSQPMS